MNKLLILHHLGLGDHFICNGIVHHFLEHYEEIWLPVKDHNIETVKDLYKGYNVILLPCDPTLDYHVTEESIRKLLYFIEKVTSINEIKYINVADRMITEEDKKLGFEQLFYKDVNISYDFRYSKFKLPKISESAKKLFDQVTLGIDSYAFVSNTSSVGEFNLKINTNLPIIKLEKISKSLLDWRLVIENAAEIHAVDSSLIHLVDQYNSTELKAKLFYHTIRSPNFEIKCNLRKKWHYVNYKDHT